MVEANQSTANEALDSQVAAMLVEDEDARDEAASALARFGRRALDAALALTASSGALSREMACHVLAEECPLPEPSWLRSERSDFVSAIRRCQAGSDGGRMCL